MESKRLYRSNSNKVFAGVCGGLGDYFNIDPVIVRLIWVAVTLFSAGGGILGYIIAAAVIPKIDGSGREKSNSGCLIAILIALILMAAVPIVISILGFVGHTIFSGVSSLVSITGMFIWLSILLVPALIIVVVILLITKKY